MCSVFFAFEIINDIISGESLLHHITESFFFLLTSLILVTHVRYAHQVKKELEHVKNRELTNHAEPSQRVQQQMDGWKLSPSEKEISWLIIKGFSFAEIAHLRGVKEKTIRAQASNIYQKSGTENRNDFAARFIDELLNTE